MRFVTARLSALALLLVLAIGLQASYATPLHATEELRALGCCSEHCNHALPVADAGRCCGIGQGTDEPGALSRSSLPAVPDAAAILPAAVAAASTVRALAPPRAHGVFGRAAPLFLLKRSLRI